MIAEDYVSFEVAKLLKEKGFDIQCWMYYSPDTFGPKMFHTQRKGNSQLMPEWEECVCPTIQMAMKWLREVHNIDVVIDTAVGMLGVKVYVPLISTYKPLKNSPSKVRQIKRGIYYKDDKGAIPALQHFDSYEEACEVGIRYCLENLI